MNPNDVPQDLVHAAAQAWKTAPQKRDGEPTRMRHALAAAWPEIEKRVRAKIAAEIETEGERIVEGDPLRDGMTRAAEIARGAS